MAEDPTSMAAIGRRLQITREALGMSQVAICQLTKISPQTWNNAETGRQRLGLDSALEVSRVTGVALDWIYRGNEELLPRRIAEYIAKPKDDPKPTSRRSRRRA